MKNDDTLEMHASDREQSLVNCGADFPILLVGQLSQQHWFFPITWTFASTYFITVLTVNGFNSSLGALHPPSAHTVSVCPATQNTGA